MLGTLTMLLLNVWWSATEPWILMCSGHLYWTLDRVGCRVSLKSRLDWYTSPTQQCHNSPSHKVGPTVCGAYSVWETIVSLLCGRSVNNIFQWWNLKHLSLWTLNIVPFFLFWFSGGSSKGEGGLRAYMKSYSIKRNLMHQVPRVKGCYHWRPITFFSSFLFFF